MSPRRTKPAPETAKRITLTNGYQLCARCGKVMVAGENPQVMPRASFWNIYSHFPGTVCKPDRVKGWDEVEKILDYYYVTGPVTENPDPPLPTNGDFEWRELEKAHPPTRYAIVPFPLPMTRERDYPLRWKLELAAVTGYKHDLLVADHEVQDLNLCGGGRHNQARPSSGQYEEPGDLGEFAERLHEAWYGGDDDPDAPPKYIKVHTKPDYPPLSWWKLAWLTARGSVRNGLLPSGWPRYDPNAADHRLRCTVTGAGHQLVHWYAFPGRDYALGLDAGPEHTAYGRFSFSRDSALSRWNWDDPKLAGVLATVEHDVLTRCPDRHVLFRSAESIARVWLPQLPGDKPGQPYPERKHYIPVPFVPPPKEIRALSAIPPRWDEELAGEYRAVEASESSTGWNAISRFGAGARMCYLMFRANEGHPVPRKEDGTWSCLGIGTELELGGKQKNARGNFAARKQHVLSWASEGADPLLEDWPKHARQLLEQAGLWFRHWERAGRPVVAFFGQAGEHREPLPSGKVVKRACDDEKLIQQLRDLQPYWAVLTRPIQRSIELDSTPIEYEGTSKTMAVHLYSENGEPEQWALWFRRYFKSYQGPNGIESYGEHFEAYLKEREVPLPPKLPFDHRTNSELYREEVTTKGHKIWTLNHSAALEHLRNCLPTPWRRVEDCKRRNVKPPLRLKTLRGETACLVPQPYSEELDTDGDHEMKHLKAALTKKTDERAKRKEPLRYVYAERQLEEWGKQYAKFDIGEKLFEQEEILRRAPDYVKTSIRHRAAKFTADIDEQRKSLPLAVLRGGPALESLNLNPPKLSPAETLLQEAAIAVGEIAGGAGYELSRLAAYQGIAYWLAEQNVSLVEVKNLQKAEIAALRKVCETDDQLIAALQERVAELETALKPEVSNA